MTDRTDTFIRADSTTTINSPSDAAGDYTVSGTWGIISNQGYKVSGSLEDCAILECGAADVTVSDVLGNVGAGSDCGIIARASDTTHQLMGLYTFGTGFRVFELNGAGNYTQKGSTTSGSWTNGHTLSLLANGTGTNGIVLSDNGTAKVTTTSSFNSTATKAGLRSYNDTVTRFQGNFTTVAAGGGGGGRLFIPEFLMNGLQTGGPFFANPIG